MRTLPVIIEGHYEIDMSINDEPYWEPSSIEDDLRSQLVNITLSEESLT